MLVSLNKPENVHISGLVPIFKMHIYITESLKVTFGEFFLFIFLRGGKIELSSLYHVLSPPHKISLKTNP